MRTEAQSDGDGELVVALPCENALERIDRTRVEDGARASAQQAHRLLVGPGCAVDTPRHQRVVHIARAQDSGVEVELAATQPLRVPAPVESLVVVVDETQNTLGETSELAQEPLAPLGVLLHQLKLPLRERPRTLEDLVRDAELADVVQEASEGESAKPLGRK